LQPNRRGRSALLVERDERRKVDVAERVAGDDEEGLVELLRGVADRAGRPERRFLDGVADVHAERLAVAEVSAYRLRQEGDGDDHVVEAVLLQEFEDVLHARLADDGDHRLRLVRGQRAQARSLAAGHDDGLHRLALQAVSAYMTAATTARTRPALKIQYGQCVLFGVTMRN